MINESDYIQILQNAPIKTNFAGLRGDTLSMQNEGWQLNVDVQRAFEFHGWMVRLLGKHPGLNLRLYSGIATLDLSELARDGMRALLNWAETMEFPIAAHGIAQNIQLPSVSQPVTGRLVDFANPMMATIEKHKVFDLDDCCFFRPINHDVDVYVPQDKIWTIQEHLNAVADMQADKQKELREKLRKKRRRESDREGQYIGSDFTRSNIETGQVKLQLVAV